MAPWEDMTSLSKGDVSDVAVLLDLNTLTTA